MIAWVAGEESGEKCRRHPAGASDGCARPGVGPENRGRSRKDCWEGLPRRSRAFHRGFTLLECAAATFLLAAGSAVAGANLYHATLRGKQKRTMGDMKTIASAIEAFNTDNSSYPVSAFAPLSPDAGMYASLTPAEGMPATLSITPDYLLSPIWRDGFGTDRKSQAFQYGTTPDGQNYTLCSLGLNGAPDGIPGAVVQGCVEVAPALFTALGKFPDGSTFDCDIVLINGQFYQQPVGKIVDKPGCLDNPKVPERPVPVEPGR